MNEDENEDLDYGEELDELPLNEDEPETAPTEAEPEPETEAETPAEPEARQPYVPTQYGGGADDDTLTNAILAGDAATLRREIQAQVQAGVINALSAQASMQADPFDGLVVRNMYALGQQNPNIYASPEAQAQARQQAEAAAIMEIGLQGGDMYAAMEKALERKGRINKPAPAPAPSAQPRSLPAAQRMGGGNVGAGGGQPRPTGNRVDRELAELFGTDERLIARASREINDNLRTRNRQVRR